MLRNFLLAKRIMGSMYCNPLCWPPLPDTNTHPLWQSWDLALETCILHYHEQLNVPPAEKLPCSAVRNFFADQLTAFETWLDFRGAELSRGGDIPMYLPIVLQILLSNSQRVRALLLLRRFLALGREAVNLTLLVGIFPYVIKLIPCPANDIKQILVHIWASILGFDPSGRVELVREKLHGYFVKFLGCPEIETTQRSMAAFVLAQICNRYRDGQESCLQMGLHRTCCMLLSGEVVDEDPAPLLLKWLALCLSKLCEDFVWAKYLCLTEAGHTKLYRLLVHPDPAVRAASVLALGEFLGASAIAVDGGEWTESRLQPLTDAELLQLRQVELQLAIQILESCGDGCPLVRREAIIGINRLLLLPFHFPCIKLVVRGVMDQERDRNRAHAAMAKVKGASNVQSMRSKTTCPWILTPSNSHKIIEQLKAKIEEQGVVSFQNSPQLSSRAEEEALRVAELAHLEMLSNMQGYGGGPLTSTSNTAAAMAPAYVRLWLALKEIQCKDPHHLVEQAAAMCTRRVELAVALERLDEQKREADERSGGGRGGPRFRGEPERMGPTKNDGYVEPHRSPLVLPGVIDLSPAPPELRRGSSLSLADLGHQILSGSSWGPQIQSSKLQPLSGFGGQSCGPLGMDLGFESETGVSGGAATWNISDTYDENLLKSHLYDWNRYLTCNVSLLSRLW